MAYPIKFLRGIPDSSFLHEGNPLSHVFQFDEPKIKRPDDHKECSINWYDGSESLNLLFKLERKQGELKYKEGVIVLSRAELDKLKKKPLFRDRLNYERREEDGNKYHGNLLMHNSTPSGVSRLISSNIAVQCFIEIIPPHEKISKESFLIRSIRLIKNYLNKVLLLKNSQE
jgi:hypothetical protein